MNSCTGSIGAFTGMSHECEFNTKQNVITQSWYSNKESARMRVKTEHFGEFKIITETTDRSKGHIEYRYSIQVSDCGDFTRKVVHELSKMRACYSYDFSLGSGLDITTETLKFEFLGCRKMKIKKIIKTATDLASQKSERDDLKTMYRQVPAKLKEHKELIRKMSKKLSKWDDL